MHPIVYGVCAYVGRFKPTQRSVIYRQCDDTLRVQKEWSCVQCYDNVTWSSVRETFSPRDEEEKHNNNNNNNNIIISNNAITREVIAKKYIAA